MDYTVSSEKNKKYCLFCDNNSNAFEYLLNYNDKSKNFNIICDPNPITESHILLIPKKHVSCIGDYGNDLLKEYISADKVIRDFISNTYGSCSVFEHGVFGQTVFHSHIHYFMFNGSIIDVIPEGTKYIRKLNSIEALKELYKKDGGYLYVDINNQMYTVNPALSKPRFFRDRFAQALGRPELGNWKAMRDDPALIEKANQMCKETQNKWQNYITTTGVPISSQL